MMVVKVHFGNSDKLESGHKMRDSMRLPFRQNESFN